MRIFVVICCIGLVAFGLPRKQGFQYNFEIAGPWRYQDLEAAFDFDVLLPEDELEELRQEAIKDVLPHYRIEEGAQDLRETSFEREFNLAYEKSLKDHESSYTIDSLAHIRFGMSMLNEVYNIGVVSIDQAHQGQDDFSIELIKGNKASAKQLSDLLTQEEAISYIKDRLQEFDYYQLDFLEPLLTGVIKPNIYYDSEMTSKLLEARLKSINPVLKTVKAGEVIIRRGAIVSEPDAIVIEQFLEEANERTSTSAQSGLLLAGNILNISLVMALFVIAMYRMNISRQEIDLTYAIPVCIVPIVVRIFFGVNLAVTAHMAVMLLSAFIVPHGLSWIFIQFIAGMVAIFNSKNARYWSQFFTSSALLLLTYFLSYFGVSLIMTGSFDKIVLIHFGWLTVSAFLTLLAYPLIPIFERLFGFVSDITLVELSDLNRPLLKKLFTDAPGTFQHSIQVANIAEAAAEEIGANSLLVKVAGLYHDIGKMNNPGYFIENQSGYNPHDDLSFDESASIIISHVPDGVEIARKYRLPGVIIDFIRTHHGTTRVEYFYRSFLKANPDENVDESQFQYPGPLPFSKETAVLMMADGIEASARSLKQPTEEDVNDLVERIVQHLMDRQQFVNSPITFKEISICKQVFKKMLASIHHIRIAYPDSSDSKKA
jgi:putative nucleotidyltransferase with HDIG domain